MTRMATVPSFNCANCGAALPPESSICNYCQTRHDLDLANLGPLLARPADRPRPCPICRQAMGTVNLNVGRTFLIERCGACFGLFFDTHELGALTELTVREPLTPNYRRLNQLLREMPAAAPARRVYVPCPICSQPMNRRNYGLRSGVAIDECRNHGVWLEAGELRRILRWVKSGGPEHMLRRRREEARELERRERARRLARAAPASDLEAGTIGDSSRRSAFWIAALVSLLLRLWARG